MAAPPKGMDMVAAVLCRIDNSNMDPRQISMDRPRIRDERVQYH